MADAQAASGAVAALDGRLRAIAVLARQGARLVDIGCDHGYLICALAADGIIPGGVACDINPLPLAKARERVERLGLAGRIDCRLADGLSAVEPDEADDIVVAGMGGELISAILAAWIWREAKGKRFLLQPMTRPEQLRGWLAQNGFAIEREMACEAAGRCYTVMEARYTGQRWQPEWDDPWLYYGALPQSPSPEGRRYLQRTQAALRRRAVGLGRTEPQRAADWSALVEKLCKLTKGW